MVMAGFDDGNFSLSGLIQEGHELNFTAISESDEEDNDGGLLQCARQLGGAEISELNEQNSMSMSSSQVLSPVLSHLLLTC